MAKLSKENYHERMRELANIRTNVKESKESQLSTLVDYQKADDGTVYGIVKENHHYFIKKSTKKENPTVSDFVYMDGLSNIKEYRYNSLNEAEKQRNFYINSLNDALTGNFLKNKKSAKRNLNEEVSVNEYSATVKHDKGTTTIKTTASSEDAAKKKIMAAEKCPESAITNIKKIKKITEEVKLKEDETSDNLDDASKKLDQLDTQVDAEETPAEIPSEAPPSEMGNEEMPKPEMERGEESPEEKPEGGEEDIDVDALMKGDKEEPKANGEETPETGEEEKPEAGKENLNLSTKELEKLVGKFGEAASHIELKPVKTKALVSQFLGSIKDKIAELDVEDRKKIADEYFMDVVPDEEIKNLETSVGNEPELKEDQECSECNKTFEGYAKNRGYESLEECPMEELTSLIGGFATAHTDGENEGDFENVAKYMSPDVQKSLSDDYGHVDYVEKVQPFVGKVKPMSGAAGNIEPLPTEIGEDSDNDDINIEDIKIDNEPLEKEENPEETPEIGFAPEAQPLGGGIVGKGISVPTKSVDINLKAGTVNMTMSESEKKLRKYIQTRLDEKITGKKSNLNESKKSANLKKLDEIIDKQLKMSQNEGFGDFVSSVASKVDSALSGDNGMKRSIKTALEQNNPEAIINVFATVFKNKMKGGIVAKYVPRASIDLKKSILQQALNDKSGIGLLGLNGAQLTYIPYENRNPESMMTGKPQYGGNI